MSDEQPAQPPFTITIQTLSGRRFPLEVQPSDTVLRVKELIEEKDGIPTAQQRLVHSGRTLEDSETLGAAGVAHDSRLHLVLKLRKPVVYLFSPRPVRAAVRVRLAPQWAFSCVYPVVDVKRDGRCDAVEWEVDVREDQCVVDVATGNEEAYLFWEAESNPRYIDSPPPSRPTTPSPLAFNPAHPVISASNSVVLDIQQVPGYLQKALKALGLHVEARTSFITYWLPDMQAHEHIALRFLPQEEYGQAAALEVSPAPAVVTRVFMLFRGLRADDAYAWRATSMDAREPACWQSIVGVSEGATNKELFRVLEWGGMEA